MTHADCVQAQGQPAKMSMSDETAVAILDTCAQKLTTLNDTIRAKELADVRLPFVLWFNSA